MSSFWSGWIIVLTVGNILFCFWLIWWTMKKRSGEAASGDVTGHTWDDDLQEYNNPLPRWWLWMFYITLVFAFGYLALYPGLGSFPGMLNWGSHESQYEAEMQKAAETYDPIFKKYAAVAVADLATGADYQEARDMGKRMYLSYCSQCHGSTATGAKGYPNLTDGDWLWGGDADRIKESIMMGRQGVMPPHEGRVDDTQLDQVAAYVQSLSGRSVDATAAEAGAGLFTSLGCVACHGVDGKGNTMLGAPNLTDDTWLYGASAGVIKETIKKGRNGVMPAHKDFLGEDKSHIIAAYIYSLSAK